MSFVLMLNIKEDILKNAGNQTGFLLWKSMGTNIYTGLEQHEGE